MVCSCDCIAMNGRTIRKQPRQCTYKQNIEALCVWKCSISYSLSLSQYVCVCVCVIQHAKHMRHIMSSVSCPALPYFSTLFYKQHNFQGKLLKIKCVFWYSLSLLSETFLIWRLQQDIVIKVHTSSCKVHIIFVRFKWNLNFIDRFSKSAQTSNLIKSVQWELSCSLWTGRQTWWS